MYETGQLVYGDKELDTGACSQVRRLDTRVYYRSGAFLHRRTLDPGARREDVTGEAMKRFEIAGDHVYFVGELQDEAFLKRISLGDPSKVETIMRRPNTVFRTLMVDASNVYVVADGQILRVAQAVDAQPETFWQETGPEAWGMAQTDSHLYWSTLTPAGTAGCSEAQVWRRPKAGGPAAVLSRVPCYCAGEIIRLDDRLYTAIFVDPPSAAPTKLLRIKL
jgi:hypothetical protein